MSNRTNPNLRPFLNDLEAIVDLLKERLPCCPNCIHFTKDGHCQYQNQRIQPPPEVIAFGCWAFDPDVPF